MTEAKWRRTYQISCAPCTYEVFACDAHRHVLEKDYDHTLWAVARHPIVPDHDEMECTVCRDEEGP